MAEDLDLMAFWVDSSPDPAARDAERALENELEGRYPSVRLGGRRVWLIPAREVPDVEATLEVRRRHQEASQRRLVELSYRACPYREVPAWHGIPLEVWRGRQVRWEEPGTAAAEGPLGVEVELEEEGGGVRSLALALTVGPHRLRLRPEDSLVVDGSGLLAQAEGRRVRLVPRSGAFDNGKDCATLGPET